MSSILVTGAAGFIGSHLVRYLAAQGHAVVGVDLVPLEGAGLGSCVAGWVAAGLSADCLNAARRQAVAFDFVFHLAGGSSVAGSFANPAQDFAATVGGTATLIEWMRGCASEARLVIVSSAAVYGNIHTGPIGDDAVTLPYSPYGAHKYAMEAIVRGWSSSFGMPAVAVRLFSVFGPGLRKQLLWDLSGRLIGNDEAVTLGGSGDEVRDWTNVADVVRALDVASGLAKAGMPILNAGSTLGASVEHVSRGLARAFGADPDRIRFSGHSRLGDPFSLVAAPGKLAATGFEWRSNLDEGLRGYSDWYLAENRT